MTKWRMTVTALALATILAGCGGGGETGRDDGKLRVVATTGQVGDLARRVGGDHVQVTALMGPGIDPHLYKASAGDVERLRRADLILYNGLHLEAKMGDVLERMGATQRTRAVAEAIPESDLLSPEGAQGTHDPHVWFDVRLWRHALLAVRDELVDLDPAHAEDYRANADRYGRELDELDAHVRAQAATIPEPLRVLITAHDAFAYFGHAYGFEVRGLQGISTVSEAGTDDVQDLAAFIATRRIPALFVETSVSPRAIEAVKAAVSARGFNVGVGGALYSDALGDAGTPEGTYVGVVRHNIDTIAAALRGEVPHEQ
jgi:manganese/zinc/iron transport system substrate-binding protein